MSHGELLQSIELRGTQNAGALASKQLDQSLLSRVVQGDEQAMASLYARHSKLVYSVANGVLRDPSAAEDVVQHIFMEIFRLPTSFHGDGRIEGWLAVIARNRSIDMLRRKRPTVPVEDVPLSSTEDIFADVERSIMKQRVRSAVALLPEPQRLVLELAYFEELTHMEIAERIGVPLGTVKSRIRGALHKLLKAFEGNR